jgi:1,4-dihydroxy-2-naphthoate octaprenyltransferase
MIRNKNKRRLLVVLLMAVGAILIFLATEAWSGYLLVVLGIIIEAVGIKLDHQ